MRHERLAIVLSDVAIRNVARLASEVSGELSAVVILHDDRMPGSLQDFHDDFSVQWNQPSDLKPVCGDAVFIQYLYRFANDTLGGPPPDERYVRECCADKCG